MMTFLLPVLLCFGAAEPQLALPDGFLLVAHRGVTDSGLVENSLEAFDAAIARGYTHVEVDVQCTSDGHPVCLHDRNLKRTAGVDRHVDELTLAELRTLAPETLVPDFETVCIRAENRIGLMLDIKGCPSDLRDIFVQRLETSLRRHGLLESALFIGRADVGGAFRGKARIAWGASLEKAKRSPLWNRQPGGEFFVFGHAEDFNRENVAAFQAHGLKVIVSINQFHYLGKGDLVALGMADVRRMLDYGVDGLQIDSVYDQCFRRKESGARESVSPL